MAKSVKNKKGFKVIKLAKREVLDLWGKFGGVGICERCNKIPDKGGYYVACINDYLCENCYKDFIKSATYYPEDEYFENMNFQEVKKRLKQLGYWEKDDE